MINEQLKKYKGSIVYKGVEYTGSSLPDISKDEHVELCLKPSIAKVSKNYDYEVTVDEFMTSLSNDSTIYHSRWNKKIPMPYDTMKGKLIKDTSHSYIMELYRNKAMWTGYVSKKHVLDLRKLND